MSASFTYGSLGDIITTAQIVYRLAQTLNESRGSAREFQDLVVELRHYHSVLQQLMYFWQSRRKCPDLEDLANLARSVIVDSKDAIDTFLERVIQKYGRSLLRRVGSRKSPWDVVKMIQWNVSEKDDVEALRNRLSRSRSIIQTVQIQAHALESDRNYALVSKRIASLMDAEIKAESKIDAQLEKLMTSLEKGNETFMRIEGVSNAILSTVSSISSNVLAVGATALSIERGLSLLQGMISSLTLFNYNTIYLEDALGWTFPILLDTHPSWETVHSILHDQFSRHRSPGVELVKSRRYAIQDSTTGKDLDWMIPFHQTTRPGQRLAMSMIFNGDWSTEDEYQQESSELAKSQNLGNRQKSKCRSCSYINMVDDSNLDIICQNPRCRLIYRVVIDVSDAADDDLEEWTKRYSRRSVHHYSGTKENEDDGYDNDDNDNDDSQTVKALHASTQKLLPSSETFVNTPEIFKRVKFLSRWEDRMDSRGLSSYSIGNIHFWTVSIHNNVAQMASFQMQVSICMSLLLNREGLRAGVPIDKRHVYFMVAFAGHSREKSCPVVFIISHSKRLRRRVQKLVGRLDWLGTSSRFSVLNLSPSVNPKLEKALEIVDRLSPASSLDMQIEAKKRLATLKTRDQAKLKAS